MAMRSSAARAATLLLFLLVALVPARTGDADAGRLESRRGGLQTATFDTLSGTVSVHLPEEIAAGDTISGSVVAEPTGDTDKKREKNLGTLSGYVLEVEDRRDEVGEGRLTLTLPERASPDGTDAAETVTLLLREVRKGKPGRDLGRVEIPIRDVAAEVASYRLPTVGQPGRTLSIPGPFDGDMANSALTVGDVEALPLAESPRLALFRSPEEVVGLTPMTLREQGEVAAEGELRNVAVRLSAPKVSLDRGESTTLTTVVAGLEDLDEEIPLTLEVWPASVVDLEGGNEHDLTIRPEEVRADGTYRLDLSLTGRVVGRWDARATVETPEPSPAKRFLLVLEGSRVGYLDSVSGGTIPNGTPTGTPITFEVGLDLGRPLYDWIRESFDVGRAPRDGVILGVDAAGAERAIHGFHEAVIGSVTFPRLDADDASPARMTVEILPQSVRYADGSGKSVGPVTQATKKWLCSNFRFELGDLPVAPVRTIDSFTWKLGVTKDEVGAFREPTKHPAGLETAGMKLTVSTSDIAVWDLWHRTFAGPEREDGEGLDGRVIFLDRARSELATVELHDATMASLTLASSMTGTDEGHSVTIELADSRISFIP
jgi:hypothetical protein